MICSWAGMGPTDLIRLFSELELSCIPAGEEIKCSITEELSAELSAE
jgi:hypothetical protein